MDEVLMPVDDDRHPLLSQAEAAGQTTLDRLTSPKEELGNREVGEVAADKALTDFTFGGNRSGVAYSLNPYAGCHHACAYCYVPSTMRAERKRWGRYVLVKRNLLRLLRSEVDRKDAKTVYVSTGTDPYQPVEAERELTRKALTVLAREEWPVEVLTRSPLVVRDLNLLHEFTNARVGLTVPTLDDDLRKLLEPGAPSIQARLDALRELSQAGLKVFANYAPAYPFTGDLEATDVAEAFARAGVQWVNTSHWRRRGSIVVPIMDALEGTRFEETVPHFVANREPQATLRTELREALSRRGIPLHTAFYNPPFQIAEFQPETKQLELGQLPIEATPGTPRRREPADPR
jgi:DNA repair photolyase